MTVLVPTDLETRGESLLRLADGWNGPESKAPDRWTVTLVVLLLRELVAEGYPVPFLYPTDAGGVRAEWPTAKQPVHGPALTSDTIDSVIELVAARLRSKMRAAVPK